MAGIVGAWALGPKRESRGRVVEGERESVYQAACASCHGERGEGKRELMAPPVANLAGWYVREQVGKYRSGLRGSEPRDVFGLQMRAAVVELSEEEVEEAMAEIGRFPFVVPDRAEGDVARGAVLYRDYCMECHRYNGHGELTFKSAQLVGLPEWYLSAQLEKFRGGLRGYHPDDERGRRMRDMTLRPADAEEVADIIAFVTTLAEEFPLEKGIEGEVVGD